MTKKRAIVLALAAVLVLVVFRLWGPSSVPQGQEPLFALSPTNLGEFEKAFDASADVPRLVLLLSPT